MAALLALLSALAYGTGDFFGGLSARRLPAAAVVLRTHAVGLVGVIVLLPLISGTLTARDAAIGAVAAVAGGTGVLLFYKGLASGVMSIVAPITSVLAAVVPVTVGLAGGERPSPLALSGIPLALVAVTLLARDPDDAGPATGLTAGQLVLALGAGLGFGLYFVGLDATGDASGLWPVVTGRATSMALFALVALVNPAARVGDDRARRGTLPVLLVACGLLDAWANGLFLLATQNGMLTLVAVIGALYPAATLVLARVVLGERLAGPQLSGVVLAGGAIALITAG